MLRNDVRIDGFTPKDRVVTLSPDALPTPPPVCDPTTLAGIGPTPVPAPSAPPTSQPDGKVLVNGQAQIDNGGVLTYEVRVVGHYSQLLSVVRDLSHGTVLAQVLPPQFHRLDDKDRSDDPLLSGTIPVTLYIGDGA